MSKRIMLDPKYHYRAPVSVLWMTWAWEISRKVWEIKRGPIDLVIYVQLGIALIVSVVLAFTGDFRSPKWEDKP